MERPVSLSLMLWPSAPKTPLSELNTLKLRLGPEEDAVNVTVMFRHNGDIMLASASVMNVEIPEE
jgi:hypothetical protein